MFTRITLLIFTAVLCAFALFCKPVHASPALSEVDLDDLAAIDFAAGAVHSGLDFELQPGAIVISTREEFEQLAQAFPGDLIVKGKFSATADKSIAGNLLLMPNSQINLRGDLEVKGSVKSYGLLSINGTFDLGSDCQLVRSTLAADSLHIAGRLRLADSTLSTGTDLTAHQILGTGRVKVGGDLIVEEVVEIDALAIAGNLACSRLSVDSLDVAKDIETTYSVFVKDGRFTCRGNMRVGTNLSCAAGGDIGGSLAVGGAICTGYLPAKSAGPPDGLAGRLVCTQLLSGDVAFGAVDQSAK